MKIRNMNVVEYCCNFVNGLLSMWKQHLRIFNNIRQHWFLTLWKIGILPTSWNMKSRKINVVGYCYNFASGLPRMWRQHPASPYIWIGYRCSIRLFCHKWLSSAKVQFSVFCPNRYSPHNRNGEHLAPCALGYSRCFQRRHNVVWDSRSSRCSQEFDTGTSPAPRRGRHKDGEVAEVSGGQDHGANVTISENAELQDSMIEEIVQVRFTVSSPPHRRVVAAESSSSSRHLYHRVQEHFR